MTEVPLRRVVRLFYGFQFFFGLLLWVPVFYEYQRRIGLTDAQIFGIQSIYYLAFCLLEIPTGLIADFWGRRRCMRAGAALVAGSNLLPIFWPGYTGFLIHFLVVALARSLISGASSAYLYDFMKLAGAADAYRGVEGKARALGLAGKVLCWAFIGALMQWKLSMPYWLTLGANAVSVGFALALPQLREEKRERQWQPSRALAALAGSPFLVFLMLQGIAVFVLERICQVNLFQPILGSKSFSLAAYGWVMALMALFEAAGAMGYRLAGVRVVPGSVFAITLVLGGALFAVPWCGQLGTLACLCVFAFGTGLAYPIQRQLVNDAIPDSRYRATLLSAESILDRGVCAWVAFVLGGYMSQGQLSLFIRHASAVTLALALCLQLGLRIWNFGIAAPVRGRG